ncbi:hypothetical protein OQA88_9455 [Cercophora sp. LCS_1]
MSAQGDSRREKNRRDRGATPSRGSGVDERRQNVPQVATKTQQVPRSGLTTVTGLPTTTSNQIKRTGGKPDGTKTAVLGTQSMTRPLTSREETSRHASPKRKPSRNRDPHCTNRCPYEAFVDGGEDEEVRVGRSRDRDLPPQQSKRVRSNSRARSISRAVVRREGATNTIDDKTDAVRLGTLNSLLKTDEDEKDSKGSVFNLRIESVEHRKKDGHCIIRFTISITIKRGNATLQDTTFKLRFRSSDKEKRLLAVVDYRASHDPLSDTMEVHHTAQRTISFTGRLGHENVGAEAQSQSQKGQEWTEPDQYRLELCNPSNDVDARLFRTGNRKTNVITPPTSFRIHVDVECPKGDGLDVIGKIEAQKSEKFVAVGDWSTVDLNRLITLRGNLDTRSPGGITGSQEDIENYLSLTTLLNASGKAGSPVAQWCLPILERHMRRKEEDRKRKQEEEEKRKKEEERKRRARRKGDEAEGQKNGLLA